ncbi:MAG TPA: phosphatidylserine decarboxylase [Candidatus Limnocylindrales bacterium]|nr:phosphatidylserine decarboxylase [Candidatus Limnocylindrales bacterium]
MVREGYSFGLPPFLIGLALTALGKSWVLGTGVALMLLGLFVFSFFRNPERAVPGEVGLIVAPADGRVVVVKQEDCNGRRGKRVSIFLAIWNVHVNRAPAAGTIKSLEYKPGRFLAAWDANASLQNEQNVFTQVTEHGEIVYKQIAGWIARRVVSWKKAGDAVARGERIGLVRFGSRVDLWLPDEAEIAVRVGENVRGGSSIIARMPEPAAVRNAAGGDRVQRANAKMQGEQQS